MLLRRRVIEVEAYHRALSFSEEGARRAKRGDTLATALFLLHNEVGENGREVMACAYATVRPQDLMDLGTVASSIQPEFLLIGALASYAADDGTPLRAYAVTVWQAGHVGPMISVGLDLQSGNRFEVRRGELIQRGGRLPNYLPWPSRRPEFRDLPDATVLSLAERVLDDVREGPPGVVGFGDEERVQAAFGELAFGGAGLDADDLPVRVVDGIAVSKLIEDCGPNDLWRTVGRGFCAMLAILDVQAFSGDDDSGPGVIDAMRHGTDPLDVPGVASDGVGRSAWIFVRDRAATGADSLPGFRLLRSWSLRGGEWVEVPGHVVDRSRASDLSSVESAVGDLS